MNPKAFLNTASAHWSEEDECFIAQSPLSDIIVGHGETEATALASFQESLAAHYEEFQAGRHALYKKAGRPAKGKKKFSVEIDPDIQIAIAACARQMNLSQGEVVEYLYRFMEKAPDSMKPRLSL